jgi:hypothetical protein
VHQMLADRGRRDIQAFGGRHETARVDNLLEDFNAGQGVHFKVSTVAS